MHHIDILQNCSCCTSNQEVICLWPQTLPVLFATFPLSNGQHPRQSENCLGHDVHSLWEQSEISCSSYCHTDSAFTVAGAKTDFCDISGCVYVWTNVLTYQASQKVFSTLKCSFLTRVTCTLCCNSISMWVIVCTYVCWWIVFCSPTLGFPVTYVHLSCMYTHIQSIPFPQTTKKKWLSIFTLLVCVWQLLGFLYTLVECMYACE